MQSLLQDLRYGWRLMWRSPGFTLAAVVTLALGIGANSAIFSILNVLSLKPLPYHDPSRVAFVLGWDVEEGEMRFNLRQADFLDLQRQVQSLESMAAYSYVSANLTGGDIPERVQAYRVTANTFAVLGVPAAVGRVFEAGRAARRRRRAQSRPVAAPLRRRPVDCRARHRAERPAARDRRRHAAALRVPRLQLQGRSVDSLATAGTPSVARPPPPEAPRSSVALAPGVSYASAQSELDVLMRTFATEHPETNRGLGARLVEMGRLDDEQAGPGDPDRARHGGAGPRARLRERREPAARARRRRASASSPCAPRLARVASRIGRQLLIEGLLLALAGGSAGVVLAMLALQALRAALPEILLTTQPNVEELGIDGDDARIHARDFASDQRGVRIASRLARVARALPGRAEGIGVRRRQPRHPAPSHRARRRRGRALDAAARLARDCWCGVTAGLQHVDPGLRCPGGVLTMAMTLPDYSYTEPQQRRQFYEAALERIERLPGVRSAGFVNVLPFSTYDRGTRLTVDGAPTPEPGREPSVSYRIASPRYYETLRIPHPRGAAVRQSRQRGTARRWRSSIGRWRGASSASNHRSAGACGSERAPTRPGSRSSASSATCITRS